MIKKILTFLLCLLPPLLCSLTGAFFRPGPWYQSLSKPWWTPPGFVFPIAWSILYLFMGISLYKLWKDYRLKGRESFLYGIQFVFNCAWSPIFFGAHKIGTGLIILFLLWLTIGIFLFFVRKDRLLVLINGFYFVWLSYALTLNAAIEVLNNRP